VAFSAAVSACLLLASCHNPTPTATPTAVFAKAFDYKNQIGIVSTTDAGQLCLTLPNPSLSAGMPIAIITLDVPQKILKAKIAGKMAKVCEEHSLMESVVSYRVQAGAPPGGMLGIGVVGFSGKFVLRDSKAFADLNDNGIEDSFHSCAGSEGVHLTVWDGEPLKWHDYHYLGFDVESDCTQANFPKQ
jgi:hypothetical protein